MTGDLWTRAPTLRNDLNGGSRLIHSNTAISQNALPFGRELL
jgi:hypothetical protein